MYDSGRFRRVFEYIWDSEPQHADFENDIICLGRRYSPVLEPPPDPEDSTESTTVSNSTAKEWPAEFLDDVEARIWMTYRTNFPVIPRSKEGPSPLSLSGILGGSRLDFNGFTSDVGWGCMIRTSQSLLATCISTITLGREWRRSHGEVDSKENDILMAFMDTPEAHYSLHNFVRHGEDACGKMPGEWFGPSAAASSIKALQASYSQDFQVYISSGPDVYEKEFLRVGNQGGDFKPTLILLGLRLGIDSVNKVYWESLKNFLSCPQAVGIAGGRPSSSHYFFGYQGDYLFYLDPHNPRPTIAATSPKDLSLEDVNSFHTRRIRRLHLSQVDPSMLVGILIQDKEDWEAWKKSVLTSTFKKIVQISPEPVVLKRSSVSVGDDDDEGFIDVLIESGMEESVIMEASNSKSVADAEVPVHSQVETIVKKPLEIPTVDEAIVEKNSDDSSIVRNAINK